LYRGGLSPVGLLLLIFVILKAYLSKPKKKETTMDRKNKVIERARLASDRRTQTMYVKDAMEKRDYAKTAQVEQAKFWDIVYARKM